MKQLYGPLSLCPGVTGRSKVTCIASNYSSDKCSAERNLTFSNSASSMPRRSDCCHLSHWLWCKSQSALAFVADSVRERPVSRAFWQKQISTLLFQLNDLHQNRFSVQRA